jgi:hypothetical protein
MAAFALFLLAVAGAAVVADLAWENPTAGQLTVLHQTISGYPEGWLLAITAGLGLVVALLLVASVNSTKRRRARRGQLRRLRHGLDQVASPEPGQGLLDAFFGPEQPSRHLGGPAWPVELESEDQERGAEAHQPVVIPQPIDHPSEPLYQQVRSAHLRKEGRAEDDQRGSQANGSTIPLEPLLPGQSR